MLHWMCGNTKRGRIMNNTYTIREIVGVSTIVENMVES
jgi:hypothetical protein